MNAGKLILTILFLLGMIFRNNLIAASAGTLLVIKLVNLPSALKVLERHSLEWGLLFLLLAVMVPFALDKIGFQEIGRTLFTPVGVVAIVGGVLAAYLCGQGVILLQWKPEIMAGLVIGTLLGVSFLKGSPVGPLAAAGLAALLLHFFGLEKPR
ncbi:MAG: DUF441 domain-containing protein [Clostridia bacterium]|nr:DUF441 domain-containing protein [Clostridia bacterium]